MLVLQRKVGETVICQYHGQRIEIMVTRAENGKVRLGIRADPDVSITRGELLDAEEDAMRSHDGNR